MMLKVFFWGVLEGKEKGSNSDLFNGLGQKKYVYQLPIRLENSVLRLADYRL